MTQPSPTVASQASRPAPDTRLRLDGQSQAAAASIIQVTGLEKTYQTARGAIALFRGLNLEVETGAMVAIVGQSGAGKSTLLHILGALDTPTKGTVLCASTDVATLTPRQAAAFRNREIGYVWQFHYLLPEFTALENVAMPLLARGMVKREALAIAANWLKEVGWKTAQAIVPANSPAANSSGWRWPEPLSTIPGSCWPTSQPATWTRLLLDAYSTWLNASTPATA